MLASLVLPKCENRAQEAGIQHRCNEDVVYSLDLATASRAMTNATLSLSITGTYSARLYKTQDEDGDMQSENKAFGVLHCRKL